MARHIAKALYVGVTFLLFGTFSAYSQSSWYGIEGLSVSVPAEYEISARDADARQIHIAPVNGGYGTGVWGFLVPSRSPGDLYVEVIEAFALLYDDGLSGTGPGELPPLPSLTITEAPSVPERRGFEIVAISPTGVQAWFHAVRLGDTPGGASGYLLLAPELPGPPGQTALATILSVLAVRVETAAG